MPKLPHTLILLLILLAACRADDVVPEAPVGSLFPRNAVVGSGNDATSPTGCTGCGNDGSLSPGFRAVVREMQLEGGNALAVSTGGGGVAFTNLTATLVDGSGMNYTFTFAFPTAVDTYPVKGLSEAGFDMAGLQYTEAVTGTAGATSTSAAGSLDVLSIAEGRVVGQYAGTVIIRGEELGLSAEFNVPLNQQ